MSENTRQGREPIEIVTLHQDFCSLRWGEFPCNAGPYQNLLLHSGDFLADAWTQIVPIGPSSGHPDPEGGDDAWHLTGIWNESTIVQGEIPISTVRPLYVSCSFAQIDADQVEFLAVMSGTSAGQAVTAFTGIYLNLNDFTYTESEFSDPLSEVIIEPQALGFHRVTLVLDAESLGFDEVDGAGLGIRNIRPLGGVVSVYGPSVSSVPNQPYIETGDRGRASTGDRPCFNTRHTCQAPESFTLGDPLKIRFASKQSRLPTDGYYIPSLISVRSTPGRLNPGGGNKNAKALGERSSLTVSLMDHPYNDRLVDPYPSSRDYDPLEQGTFWTKWRARNPYWLNRRLDHVSGYLVDGKVVDAVTRTFFITDFAGPDGSGRVSFKAKDVLSQTDASKAQAPRASSGRLASNLSAAATSFDLGVDTDLSGYPPSGYVRINKEVMAYTRSGLTMTVARGRFTTEPAEHEAGDVVQWCLEFSSAEPNNIASHLLTEYAGVDPVYLALDQWADEVTEYIPRRYSTLITEPTAVSDLLSELEETAQFMLWWDERAALVLMRAVRDPTGEEVMELDDDRHLLADSVVWRDLPDQLVTQVWVYYGQINPAEKLDDTTNYRVVEKVISPESESDNLYGQQRIRKIFTRWIPSTGSGNAADLGSTIIRRFARVPREAQFSLDAKDRDLWLADYIRIQNRSRVDFYGEKIPVNMQVLEAQESEAGTTFSYTANEYQLVGPPPDPSDITITIATNYANINLYDLYVGDHPPPQGGETITFVVPNGVTIGGYSVGGVNVEADDGSFISDEDFYYSGGLSYIDSTQSYFETINFGDIPILQRQGIAAPRFTARGATYHNLDLGNTGQADVEVREYPVSAAISTGDWPEGVTLRLVIQAGARVIGEGGNGSCHATTDLVDQVVFLQSDLRFYRGVPGGDGGHCFDIAYPIEIDNQGIIAAGGGGGGTARFVHIFGSAVRGNISSHGGGGAGYAISDVKNCLENGEYAVRRQPSIGDFLAGGAGGIVRYSADDLALGGAGGGPAADGGVGSGEMSDFGRTVCAGGKPGKAVVAGGSLITWAFQGDLTGEIVS